MTKEQIDAILDRIRSWPAEDQEELVHIVRAMEAERTGFYVMSDEERAAVADARRGEFVSDEEAVAFWKRFGLA